MSAIAVWSLALTLGSPSVAQSLGVPTVQQVVAGEGSLTVVWVPPANDAGIVGYDVRYINSSVTDKSDDTAWTEVADVWKEGNLIAVIEGLTNGTSYDVAIRARTSSLTSNWSAAISGTPADPGSTVSTASTIYSDIPLQAELSSGSDVDFYTFTVVSESEYIIWTTGETDTFGELTMSDGTSHTPFPIANNDRGFEPESNNFMIFGTVTPGTYYFKVTKGPDRQQGIGPYIIHLHLSEDTTGRSDAMPVTLNSRTPGVVDSGVGLLLGPDTDFSQDRDFYRLDISTETSISVHVDTYIIMVAEILDSNGKVVVPNQPGYLRQPGKYLLPSEDIHQFALHASLSAGTYYIRLASDFITVSIPYGPDLRIPHDAPYFLHVNESPVPAATLTKAVDLPLNTVAGGTAAQDSDSIYRLILAEGMPIELSGSSRTDEMSVELLDQAGNPLDIGVYKDHHEEGLTTVHSFLVREVLDAGTYYLNVRFKNPGSKGRFLTLLLPNYQYLRQQQECPPGQLGVDDHLHGCQWHLRNTGQLGGVSGEDINLGAAWTTTQGAGINVVVVDEGIDYLHVDLRDNFDPDTSGSAFGDQADLLTREHSGHGTAVAGIIGARDNGVGVVGVAPRATISAFQIFDQRNLPPNLAGLIQAFSLSDTEVSIRNHSWAPDTLEPNGVLETTLEMALEASRTNGDGGKGTLQIQAAGNEGQEGGYTTHNRFLNNRGVAAVCGVDDQGNHYIHSTPGSNLWVCAPTFGAGRPGIATTEAENRYRMDFGGTSASAPIVSGVAALVRAANRELTWRDTKLILSDSTRVVSDGDSSWADGAAKYSDPSEIYRYSHLFGFGVVDADRAVKLAQNWTLLPDEMSVSATQSTGVMVVDFQPNAAESSVDVQGAVSFIEHVEVTMDVATDDFRDLDIKLVSPSGKISKLSVPHQCDPVYGDNCDVNGQVVMSSTRHLGENSKGTWTLRIIYDGSPFARTTMVTSWGLTVYGHTKAQVVVPAGVWVPEKAGSASIDLKGDPLLEVSLTAAFADGTAVGGSDCSTDSPDFDNDSPATQTLTAGTSAHSLSVISVCSDTSGEGDETFTVTLTASPGVFDTSEPHCSSPTTCTVTVHIIDDDEVVPVPTDWGLVPSNLNAGDRFRLLFKTSTTRDATATGIGVYDSFVRAAASASGAHNDLKAYADRFKVFGSTEAVPARVHNALWNGTGWVDGSTTTSSSGVPIYWPTGEKYADNYYELCDFGSLSDSEKTALENGFHYGNIRSESGASETTDREPFTGTGQSCETLDNLYLGASPDVRHGAAGAATEGDNAWDVSPWSEGSKPGSESGPFYALSPVFEVSSAPTVDLVVTPTEVAEGGSVTLSATISTAQSVMLSIPLSYTDGTAKEGLDYSTTGDLIFPANMTTSLTKTLSITEDNVYEKDETFTISLDTLPSTPTLQPGATSSVEVTITDEADRPQMSIAWTNSAVTVEEGKEASFTITADRASSFDQAITVSTGEASSPPSAASGFDYTALSGTTITLPAGALTATGAIRVTKDRLDESTREKFRVELDAPSATADYTIHSVDYRSADLSIIDQNPTNISLSVQGGAAAIAEEGGTKEFTVGISRALEGSESLTVTLNLAGTAEAGTDYALSAACTGGVVCDLTTNPANPTITFSSGGPTEVSVTLTALQDTIDEGTHETVIVGLATPSASDWSNLDGGAAHLVRPTTFALTDDDAPQSLEMPTVRHVVEGEQSLTVAWDPPSSASEIIGYDVRYILSSSTSKNDPDSWTELADVWSSERRAAPFLRGGLTAVVEGLLNGTSYDVAVRARTTSLTSGWSAAEKGTPAEPGSTVTTASTVYSDVPVQAELSSTRDVDFYTFTVNSTSDYIIWSTGDTDTVGEITLSDGTSRTPPLRHNNANLIEIGLHNFAMIGTFTPGTYYVKVTSGPFSSSPTHLWRGTGTYTLHIHLSEDTTGLSDAPTVTVGSRTTALMNSTFDSVIHPDSDFFKLVLPTATTISAHVELPTSDMVGQILDSSGNLVTPSRPGYLEPFGTQAVFHTALDAGTYYIQMGMGDRVRDEPYFLYVNESPGAAAATRAEAVNLPQHTVAAGTAQQDADSLYRVVLAEETMIELRGSSMVDEMEVELRDTNGNPLDIGVYKGEVEEPLATVHTFMIREFLPAGTYYLNVKFKNPGSIGSFLTLLHIEPRYLQQQRLCPPGQLGVSDHLHGCQWYLHNTGQLDGVSGEDINIGNAWATTKGDGINVTVVDEGLDFRHIDLRDNFDLATSGSAFGDPADVLAREPNEHGTLVGGVIGARDNGVGVVGVAPRATISAYQIFSPDSVIADMAGLIQAFSLRAPEVSIRNHSWSPNQKTPRAQLPAAVEAALDLSRTNGDGGRGTLQISSAGNNGQEGGYTSYDRYLNYRGVVAVCGVDDHGDPYIHSNPGPNLWVCAPTDNGLKHWGITSTLQRNLFWTGFSGTSASTPMVSGVAALVRAANRDLSWRDTKLILADSARVVNSGDSSWDEGASKYSIPSETYRYSHRYGFGVVDADRAVRLAQSWTLLPPEMSVSATQTTGFLVDTPNTPVESSVDIGGSMTFVEHVEVTLDLGFGVNDFRDLDIELESPSGKISKLSVPYQCDQSAGDNCAVGGIVVMSSTRHLGEDPEGTWTLRITDYVLSLFPLFVNGWDLKIYGHQEDDRTSKASLSVTPDSVIEGGSFDYTITLDHAPGDNNRVTVNFLTADGTATAGEDYTPVLGVGRDAVSFGPTETSKTVTVNTLRGVVGHDELPETLSASISRATLYVGLDATGVLLDVDPDTVSVTINDHPDDVPDVWFEAAAPGVVKNSQEAQFVVHVANPLSTDLTVPYETRPPNGTIDFYGSAVSSAGQSDFAASQSGTVTITAGKTSAAFTVATTDDSDPDYEFFQVHGRGTAPTGTRWRPDSEGGASAEVVIEPDRAEATVYLVAVPSEPQEGDTVGLWAHFAQGGTAAKRTGITVTATGADGATADEFELTDGELSIARGKQGTLNNPRELGTITIAEDADYDPGETITLTGTTNRGNEVKGLTLAIGNTTPIPANLVFTDSSEDGVVAEGGSVGVTVSLGRPLIAGETVEVTLRLPHDAAGTILGETTLVSVGNGEAGFSVFSPLADITRRHPVTNREVTYQEMTVRFSGAGAQTGTLTLTLGDDGVAQDPMLIVSLRITEVTVTGLDEEVAPGVKSILFIAVDAEGVLITPTALEIGEGDTGTYQVSLRSDPGGPVTVSIASENEDAVTVNPSSLTFTSSGSDIWSTPKSVTVTAVSDEDGSDEVVNITHKVSGYGDVTAGPLVGVVVRDDDIPNYRVPADWSLIPTGVSVGESFRLVLVTSQTTKASSDQISFYNDFVKEQVESGHSDIQAYAKDFRAWLSTEDVDGRDNTRTNPTDDGTGHPVYWLNTDTKVADNNAGLYGDGTGGWAGSGVGRDESGNSIPEATTAWWGSNTDGTQHPNHYVDADSKDIRLTDVGNPTDAHFRNAAAKTNRVLAFSPIFKVVGKPTIDILPDTDTVTEGTAATFTVSSTPPPFNNLTVSLWVNDGGDFLAGENEGSQMVTISGGSSSAVLSLPTTPDDVDEPLAPISVLVLNGQDYEVKSTSFIWLTVEDDDPTTVTLSRSDSGDLTEDGGTAEFTVTLGRPLVSEYLLPQEILTVPLTVSGVDAAEYSITLKTGTGLNTGVSLSTSAPYSAALPAVVFAGDSDLMNPFVQTATLVFTSLDDSIDEGASETASIGLGTAVTSLGGGATTSGTATMTVTDDDTAALVFSSSTVSVTEGGSASYMVRLGSQPSGTVTVTISGAGDVSVSPSSLTFNPSGSAGLWSTDQTVTVSAASDADISDDMVSLSHTASGGDYGSVTGSVSVTVEDDDVPKLSISGPTAGVTEGGEAVFTVTADYAPTANLSVLLTVTDVSGSDFVASGDEGNKQVTLSAGETSVSYTVSTVADSTDEPDGNITVALRTSVGKYKIASGSDSATASVVDDDVAELVFSPSSSVAVTEEESAEYMVRLGSQPSGTVTVTISGAGDVSVSPSSLTFNPSGSTGLWSTDQTVMVSAGEDPDGLNDSAVLSHSASGGDYGSVSGDVTVTVTDNDSPNLVFSSSSVTVNEGGSSNYMMRLSTQPSSAVTVNITGGGDVSVNPSSLTFNPSGSTKLWSTDQTVTVSAGSDDDISDESVTLSHSASGGDYSSVTGSVSVTVDDDDLPELSVAGPKTAVTEGGDAVFTISSDYAPAANLFVLLTVTDAVGSDFVASGNEGDKQVTLTAGSKSVSYTVPTVADSVDEPDGNIAVALRASSGVYTIAPGSGLDTAAVNDDDSPGLMFSSSSVSVTEGGNSSYSVRLSTQPSGAVTVNITGGGNVSVSPSSLTFNPSGSTGLWSTDQTVTVSAEEDPDSVNDSVVLAHAASGGGYVFVSGDVTVSVTDNDTPNLVFSTSSVTVSEGSTTSYMVRLGSQPSDTVTVTISGADDVSVSPSSLTFNATGNTDLWNINQTVTVTAGQDPDSVNDTVTISHSASGGGYGSVTGSVTVTVEDDDDDEEEDVPELSISGPTAAVTEGGDAVFTVTADEALAADLSVLLTVSDVAGSDFIASGDEGDQQVTLTAGSTTVSYTVPTVGDSVDEPDGNITVALRTSAGNYTIASGSGSATAAIQDDDNTQPPPTPNLVFTPSSLIVTEGDTAEYTVRLATEPSGAVTVTISDGGDVSVSPPSLIFNPSGSTNPWNTNQTVTVTAGQDPDSDNDTATISHSASGGGYGSVTGSVTVTVEDDDDEEEDVPELSISGPTAAVTEGGDAVFTVTADNAPTADLSVLLTVTDVTGSDFIAPGDEGDQQVTLTAGSTTASYTVPTVGDSVDEPDGNITVALRTSAGNYTIASGSGSATAAIQDDDSTLPPPTPGLAFTPSSLTVAEGGSSSYMVGLATEPSDTVTISISGDGDVSVSPETLVFPVSDWETALAVTVNAGEDVDTADDSVSLSHSASGGGYTEVTGLVSVRVSDNDPPPPPLADLVVWVSAGDPVTEGGVAVFTITSEGFPDAPIRVYYTVSESGGFVRSSDEGNGSIRFNGSPVQVRVETVNDSRDEPSGWVRLRLVSRTGYEVSATGGAARVTVRDNDVAPPPKPTPPPLPSPEELPEYIDVEGEGVHYEGIRRLQANGVIEGTECADGFCGSEPVEHWVMAVWLVRLLDGATSPDKPVSEFEEGPENEWWAPYSERLATLEITPPCGPEDQSVCSEEKIPRAQMAGLLARALKMDLGPPQGLFKDVDPNSPNAAAIETLYLVGIIKGCSPRPDLRFCPDEFTSRSQLATLIHRTRPHLAANLPPW